MKKTVRAIAAVLGFALAAQARAQEPVDLEDRETREVFTEVLGRALDDQGRLVPAQNGPLQSARLNSVGGLARVSVAGPDLALRPPSISTSVDDAAGSSGVQFELSNARFTRVGDRTTQINVVSGAARTTLRAEGLIDVRLLAAGLGIDQPLRFTLFSFAATDLGPLFVGNALFRPVTPDEIEAPPGGASFALPGPGRVCAMRGSPFLDPRIGVAECEPEAFSDLVAVEPAPFDPRTGTLRAVGVRMVLIEPFSAFGLDFQPAAIPLIELEGSSLRLTEHSPAAP